MLDMAGEDAVGLGSDFDGIDVTPVSYTHLPQKVIDEEKAKEEKYKATLAQVEERLAQLQK